MYKILLFCTLFLALCLSCREEEKINTFHTISIDLNRIEEKTLEDWFESIDLIPLDPSGTAFLKDVSQVIIFNDKYYVLDQGQHQVFAFDSIGQFINSTERLQGAGPNEYRILTDFDIDKKTEELHILDPSSYKIRIYDKDLAFVRDYRISQELLPLAYFKHLRDDFYAFYAPTRQQGKFALNIYKAGEEKLVGQDMESVIEEADLLPNTLYSPFYELGNKVYFTQEYPNNEVFSIDVENLSIQQELQYDFKEHTFHLEDIQSLGSENQDDYMQYMEDNNDNYAFITNKGENEHYYIVAIYYKHRFAIIRHDKKTDQNEMIVTDLTKKGILGRPILVDGDYYYSAVYPEDIPMAVCDSLLTENAQLVFANRQEDDNQILVRYKFK
jgi:hypothetical protein